MKIVIATGGFDPLHSGHVSYLQAASQLGFLVVGVNSDAWLARKKGAAFMPWLERASVVSALGCVGQVIAFDDSDGTAIDAIARVRAMQPDAEIVFVIGGDRSATNTPEMVMKDVVFKFGVGGEDKKNSSSSILQEWKGPVTVRPWGSYRVIYNADGTKVKELTVQPGQSLSLQRHRQRAEHWHVVSGGCTVEHCSPTGAMMYTNILSAHQQIDIPAYEWHRLYNPLAEPCRIIEIQYGTSCVEEDIERRP
jgi:cytidyltransferase-like protein